MLEGMLLKPNMVLPGLTCPTQETVDEVADATVKCLLRTVPAAVPGIAFLSGGQSGELASARLNAMNVRFRSRLPWAVAFSFARAIQQPALEIWSGEASERRRGAKSSAAPGRVQSRGEARRILGGDGRQRMMTTSLRVYFIRHGATDWTVSGQYTGGTDVPLSARRRSGGAGTRAAAAGDCVHARADQSVATRPADL